MIPIVTIIVAVSGFIVLVGGIIFFILRMKGERLTATPDQEETQRVLNNAFGKTSRWGTAGGVEAEAQDHANHGADSSDASSSD